MNQTKIFQSYSDFYNRENKTINGVSESFAQAHQDFEKQNENNEGCWNCSRCSGCSGCSRCSDCSGCSGCSRCSGCSGCSRCSDCSGCSGCSRCSGCSGCSRCSDCSGCSGCYGCSDCSRCSRCSRCSDCSGCSDCSDCSGLSNASPVEQSENSNAGFKVPVIENIHQKVLEAVTAPNHALNMGKWHSCETTHCRAGWVVTLAGKEGKELEQKTSTAFAALQIYDKSSKIKVPPTRFYDSDKKAMADIVKCAELEKENR